MTTLAESAPDNALLDVDTEAEIIPFKISCFAFTPIFTASAALIIMLLSLALSLPTMAFLSVKNMFKANVPPAELLPPDPATAIAILRILVKLFAVTPTDPELA